MTRRVNTPKDIERTKRWHAAHPERVAQIKSKYAAKKRTVIAELKAGGCEICGKTTGRLDFHHPDGDGHPDGVGRLGIKALRQEAKRCVVICHTPCHQELHGQMEEA